MSASPDPLAKPALRRALRAEREALPAETVASASAVVAARAVPILLEKRPAVVSAYLAMGRELDPAPTAAALRALGVTVALPRVVARGEPLRFHAWQPGEPLETASLGVRQPPAGAPEAVPDILLVPLLAFDPRGFRLGYGGGFYDRTLAQLRATRPVLAIGIALERQLRPSLPVEPWDQPLDLVVTEAAVHRFVPAT
ncbi:MAG: 5-formyltetrahydrofolate cyclo-ligase [Geminicoccaceae bacterium]